MHSLKVASGKKEEYTAFRCDMCKGFTQHYFSLHPTVWNQAMAVQLSRQLRAVRDGSHVVSTERLAELGFDSATQPKHLKSRSRSARKPKPAQKPKAGGALTVHPIVSPILHAC